MPFEIRDHLGVSFIRYCDNHEVSSFDRRLIRHPLDLSSVQAWLESFDGFFGLLRVARSNDDLDPGRAKTQRQRTAQIPCSAHDSHRKLILHNASRNGEKDLPSRAGEAPSPILPP